MPGKMALLRHVCLQGQAVPLWVLALAQPLPPLQACAFPSPPCSPAAAHLGHLWLLLNLAEFQEVALRVDGGQHLPPPPGTDRHVPADGPPPPSPQRPAQPQNRQEQPAGYKEVLVQNGAPTSSAREPWGCSSECGVHSAAGPPHEECPPEASVGPAGRTACEQNPTGVAPVPALMVTPRGEQSVVTAPEAGIRLCSF